MFEERKRNQRDDTCKQIVIELGADVVRLVDQMTLPRDVDLDVKAKHTGVELPVHMADARVATGYVDPVPISGMLNDVTVLPHLTRVFPFHDVKSHSGKDLGPLSVDQSHDSHLSGGLT
jgi:hypothetical protein